MPEALKTAAEVQPEDIVFECPQCGKSLAIDPLGAGLLVVCPTCQTEVQVPLPSADAEDGPTTEQILASLEIRLARLERLRSQDKDRFAKIAEEMAAIQAALDRTVSLIEESLIQNGPEN